MASFVLSFFPLDVLDEIWDLIESVSEGFLTYSTFVEPCHPVKQTCSHKNYFFPQKQEGGGISIQKIKNQESFHHNSQHARLFSVYEIYERVNVIVEKEVYHFLSISYKGPLLDSHIKIQEGL